MWFKDGQPFNFVLSGIAIGWLERGHAYPTGVTTPAVIARLGEMLLNLRWGPGFMGYHHCDLGFCGTRLGVRSLVEQHIPPPFISLMSLHQKQREMANASERDAAMRRTLRRHRRRHHLPDNGCELKGPRGRKMLRSELAIWKARSVTLLTYTATRGIYGIMDAFDAFPHQEQWGSRRITVGASNLFIPGSSKVYIAPSMLLHYILRHKYRAADEFCDALLSCPAIGTRTYFEVLRPGLPELTTSEFTSWVEQQLKLLE
jgi:hypothetical protein